jgi:hypothetical protein
MTKKFWNDWQKRKGETKNVFAYNKSRILILNPKDEIVEIKFDNDNDYVYITVNHCYTAFSNGNVHFGKELMNHSYHRTDIKNIEFIKY